MKLSDHFVQSVLNLYSSNLGYTTCPRLFGNNKKPCG